MRFGHTKLFERARRQARKHGHLIDRFHRGRDAEGRPDPFIYGSSCRFCGFPVLVAFVKAPGGESLDWRILGSLTSTDCGWKREMAAALVEVPS